MLVKHEQYVYIKEKIPCSSVLVRVLFSCQFEVELR